MSFGQIGAILNRAAQQRELGQEQVERTSISTQAYTLFSEGKTGLQVAIDLQIKADEAIDYQKEYLKLRQHNSLNQIYQELKDDIWSFINLHKLIKAALMNAKHVDRLLTIANNDIPRIEGVIERLRFVLDSKESERTMEGQILDLHSTLYQYRVSCQEEKAKVDRLLQKKLELEQFVRQYENDEEYTKIRKTVKQDVENALANHRQLL